MRLGAALALVAVLAGCGAQQAAMVPADAEAVSLEGWVVAPDKAPPPRSARRAVAEEASPPAPAPEAGAEAEAESLPEPGTPEAAEAEPAAEPEAMPVVVKSPEQIACERKGGRYAPWGKSTAMVCFTTPRDAGKACRKSTDCTAGCLARSRTCAPMTPIYGCTELLNDLGGRVTECLE